MKLISIIVPAFNEELVLDHARKEIEIVRTLLPNYKFEFIIIDNGSSDRTREIALGFAEQDPDWKYIRFSRNYGAEASIAAGLRIANGDAAVVCFSDLQDHPSYIPDLVREWENGYQIVYGVYSGNDHEKAWKRWMSVLFYKILNNMSDIPLIPYAGDFRLIDRKVLRILARFNEKNRYMRGLTQWVGYKSKGVPYIRKARHAGKSKASVALLFHLAFSTIVNFSNRPLRLMTIFGGICSVGALLLSAFYLYNYFFRPIVPGLTTIHLMLAFNLGLNSLFLGVAGEYIGKIYGEVKNRPIAIIDESKGLDIKDDWIG